MKRRWKELGKDALIGLLLCTAAVLTLYIIRPGPFLQLPGVSALAGALGLQPTQAQYQIREAEASEAVRPTAISVNSPNGRLTAQYDFAAADAQYESLGRWLGEALGTAGTVQSLTGAQWTALLEKTGVYYAFPGYVPLRALANWLGAELTGSSPGTCARAMTVAVSDGAVELAYETREGYVGCQTQVSASALLQALENSGTDGSFFVFEASQSYPQLAGMDPCCLISPNAPSAFTASKTAQVNVEQAAVRLGFNPYGDTGYTAADGSRVFSDSGSQLRISGSRLSYTAAAPSAAGSASDTALTESARALLADLTGSALGDARLYLTDLNREGDMTTLVFRYVLGGCLVDLEGADAAWLTYTGGTLTALELEYRTYTLTQTPVALLPVLQAAALAPQARQLELRYAETGEDTLSCGWRAVG